MCCPQNTSTKRIKYAQQVSFYAYVFQISHLRRNLKANCSYLDYLPSPVDGSSNIFSDVISLPSLGMQGL